MANLSVLETDTFFSQVEKVRGEIRTKFARAHQILQHREAALLAELEQLEAVYKGEGVTEQIEELNQLKEVQVSTAVERTADEETLKQSVSLLDARIREIRDKFETDKANMSVVVLEWEIEGRLREVGAIRVSPVPNYKKKGDFIMSAGKHHIKKSTAAGVFYYPQSMAIDTQTGNVFICDGGNDRVQVFDKSFQFVQEFSEKMDKPYGICTSQHKVYVTQRSGHSLNSYTDEGKFLKSVGKEGENELEFASPTAVAISADKNRIYVCEFDNKRVQCLNMNLSFNSYIAQIILPRDIKLTSDEIVVLESEGKRIIYYNYSHELTREMILLDVVNPRFFCLDLLNNILITDYSANCVFIFSPSGELIHKFGRKGAGREPGELNRPTGIDLDSDNRIVIVSQSYGCVQLF